MPPPKLFKNTAFSLAMYLCVFMTPLSPRSLRFPYSQTSLNAQSIQVYNCKCPKKAWPPTPIPWLT